MNIGALGTLSPFLYQATTPLSGASPSTRPLEAATASEPSTQDPVLLQALTAAYASLASSANGSVNASGSLSSLASGIYSLGGSAPSTSGLAAASTQLSMGQSTTSVNGLLAAVNLDATAALAAYSYRVNAATASSAPPTAAASTTAGTQTPSLQSAIQAALSVSTTSSLSLLG